MTGEERHKLYCDFHSGVRMMMDKVEKMSREKDGLSLTEMSAISDIMKDMAMTEKDIAKAHYYYSERPDEVY